MYVQSVSINNLQSLQTKGYKYLNYEIDFLKQVEKMQHTNMNLKRNALL